MVRFRLLCLDRILMGETWWAGDEGGGSRSLVPCFLSLLADIVEDG